MMVETAMKPTKAVTAEIANVQRITTTTICSVMLSLTSEPYLVPKRELRRFLIPILALQGSFHKTRRYMWSRQDSERY